MNRSQSDLSLSQILEEAQHRWLRPIEVCGILMNHNIFKLEEEPPLKPQGGSFFLFDRKAVRYFRKDGHSWRKKKDGKTVKEAHERLKAGSKEVLHCYYAHGEDNEHFQRRSYWLLERDMEHIVFVHYRDVKKENKTQVFNSFNEHIEGTSYQSQKIIPSLPQVSTLVSLEVFNQASSPSASENSLPLLSPHYDGYDSSDDPEQSVISDHELPGRFYHASGTNSKSCTEDNRMASTESSLFCAQKSLNKNYKMTDGLSSMLGGNSITGDVASDQQPFLSLSDPSHAVNQSKSFTWEKSEMSGSLMVSRNKETKPPLTRTCMASQNSSIQDHSPVQSVSDLSTSLIEHSGTTPQLMAPFGTRNMLIGLVIDSQDKGISHVQEKTSHIKESGEQHQNDSHGRMSSEQFGYETSYQRPFISTKGETPKSHNYQMQKCMMKQKQKQDFLSPNEQNKVYAAATTKNTSHPLYSQIFKDFQDDSHLQQEEQESLKKIDSFGRCMYQEIAAMGETPFFGVSLDSATHFTEAFDEKTVRSEGTQLSVGLSLSLSRKECFNILDFSPDHAFSIEETKVLITGEFLESLEDTTECKWFCVFGNMEVPAELLFPGVLRTKAPSHAPGRVPLFITRGDGVSCSNTREFCYLASSEPPSKDFTSGENCLKQDKQDMLFQIRFSMLLSDISQTHASNSFPGKRDTPAINTDEWTQLEHASVCGDSVLSTIKENLVEQLLKEKLHNMQISNVLSKGELILDKNGLGMLHMGAALGYDWAIGPLLSSGCVNINFRDARGWTALHWAANCGREKTVVALLAAGADPGVKTDPTPEFPAGQTPADLASRCGQKGIAGYLAESSLTGHLSTLTFWDGKVGKISAPMADRSAVDTVSERTSIKFVSVESEGQATMQDSLAAMRNATQAAARIQFALRALSFERRQEVKKSGQEEYGISDDELQYMLALKKPPRTIQSARDEDMQSAAIRIQQKFRSWKGRRDFLLFRQRIVKIQAHIRGHQVRQQYKKITWSVGILEKAILRWRRKGKGLRGFHQGTRPTIADDTQMHPLEEDDFLKAGRKQIEAGIEKALARVHSMVKSSEAREQYRRLLNGFELAKAHLDSGLLSESSSFAADYTSCTPMSDM